MAPEKKAEGTVSQSTTSGRAAAAAPGPPPPPPTRPLSGGLAARTGPSAWPSCSGAATRAASWPTAAWPPNKDSVFNKDFGVEVELLQIDDFVKSRDAFRAGGDKGGVDIMWSTVDAYALEYGGLSKLNPKAIMQYDWSRGGDAIAVDASIKSVADLRGKKLACAQETPSHYFALYVLSQGGLSNRDVNWVFTDSAVEAANVFKAGKVDAAVSWSPDVYVAARERQGGHILASTKEASNLIADIFVARGDFVEKYPEDVRRFVGGWLRGVDMVRQNPDRAAVLLQKSLTGVNTLEDAQGHAGGREAPRLRGEPRLLRPPGLAGQLLHDLPDRAGHLAQDRQDQDVYQPAPDGGHALHGRRPPSGSRSRPPAAAKPEFEFKAPPKAATASILTKTVSIYFPTGSSALDENAKAVLDTQVVDLAATFGSAYMRIAGNTDNVGGRDANVRLSRARADAVTRYLMTKGFERNKFDVRGQRTRQAGGRATTATRAGPRTAARTSRSSPADAGPRPRSPAAAARKLAPRRGGAVLRPVVRAELHGPGARDVILPSPTDVVKAFPVLHFEEALVRSAGACFYRVMMGFLLAAAVAIPLGLLMGTYPPVKHFFAPILDPLRFLPISALVPLFIVWFGIDDMQKIMFLFVGTFVYLLPLVVEAVEGWRRSTCRRP